MSPKPALRVEPQARFIRQRISQVYSECGHRSGVSPAPFLPAVQPRWPCVRSLNSPNPFLPWSLCIFCKDSPRPHPVHVTTSHSLLLISNDDLFPGSSSLAILLFFSSQLLFVSLKALTTIYNYSLDYFLFSPLN